jgi:hypothetical protein
MSHRALTIYSWVRLALYAATAFYLIRSGLTPRGGEPRKWYDRTLRVTGGVLIAAFLLFVLFAVWRR